MGTTHKRCDHCKEEKPVSEFHRNKRQADSLAKRCKTCASVLAKKYMDPKREKYREYSRNWCRRRRGLLRAVAWDYKATHPCVDCGEKDPILLDFDRKDRSTKLGNIHDLMRVQVNVETLLEEISKCDVRCGNCHSKKTYFEYLELEMSKELESWAAEGFPRRNGDKIE